MSSVYVCARQEFSSYICAIVSSRCGEKKIRAGSINLRRVCCYDDVRRQRVPTMCRSDWSEPVRRSGILREVQMKR